MSDFFSAILEKEPNVPKLKPISVDAETAAQLAATQKYMPQAADIASNLNTLTEQQWQKMLGIGFPQYAGISTGVTDYIKSLQSGIIPQDVQENIQRSGAVRSLYGGYSGTGMGRNLVARDLGITSLNLMQHGLDAATRWTTMAQQSTAARFISPANVLAQAVPNTMQRIDTAFKEREQQFQRKYMANIVSAHYDWTSRVGRGLDAALDIVLSAYGMSSQPNTSTSNPTNYGGTTSGSGDQGFFNTGTGTYQQSSGWVDSGGGGSSGGSSGGSGEVQTDDWMKWLGG